IGVTEPVVFQNFGSKADLFVAVPDRAAEQATTLLDPSADALSVLTALLEPGAFERMHQRGGPGALFADAVLINDDERIVAAHRRATGHYVRALIDLIANGQRSGSLRGDVSA